MQNSSGLSLHLAVASQVQQLRKVLIDGVCAVGRGKIELTSLASTVFLVGAVKWEGKSVRWAVERRQAVTCQGQQKIMSLDDIWSEVGRYAGKFFFFFELLVLRGIGS